jgi:hypothetical protein
MYSLHWCTSTPVDALQVPEKVLQRRLHQRGIHSVPQLLVKWLGLDSDLATWEDEVSIKQRFPAAPAWGHAGIQGGGLSAALT